MSTRRTTKTLIQCKQLEPKQLRGLLKTWRIIRENLDENGLLISGYNRFDAILESYGWSQGVEQFICRCKMAERRLA